MLVLVVVMANIYVCRGQYVETTIVEPSNGGRRSVVVVMLVVAVALVEIV